MFQGDVAGNVFFSKKRARALAQRVPRAKRRCCMTHIGLVCNRPDIQKHLPQVLIVNRRTVPASRMPALRAACPANVRILREKSAWTNIGITTLVVSLLGAALRPFLDTLQPILLMDSLRAHWHPFVLAACRCARIWPLCVPASLTWLMQPLDTHVFLKYKRCLRDAYQDARGLAELSDIDIGAFLHCVFTAIRDVLEARDWASAFRGVGFGGAQASLERFVRRGTGLADGTQLALPTTRPSDSDVSKCFDANYRVQFGDLWRTLCPPAVAVRLGVPRLSALASARAVAKATVFSRGVATGS